MTPGQGPREVTSWAERLRAGVGFSRKSPGEGRQGRHSGRLLAEETREGQAGDTGHGGKGSSKVPACLEARPRARAGQAAGRPRAPVGPAGCPQA